MKNSHILLLIILAVGIVGILSAISAHTQNSILGVTRYNRQQKKRISTPTPTFTIKNNPTAIQTITPSTIPSPTNRPTAVPVTPIATPTLTKTSAMTWGAYVSWDPAQVKVFQTLVGKVPNYLATFVHWGNENDLPVSLGNLAKSQNQTLVIYWEAMDYNVASPLDTRFNYDAILSGKWDAYITSFAAQSKSYGSPIIIVPFGEMNSDWYPWSGTINNNTSAKHVAAFQYVRKFFTSVPNVKFAWAPNNDSVPDVVGNQISDYYPGDEFVDYVGVDGFNFGNPWQSFTDVFNRSLTSVEKYNKPVIIFSMSSAPGIGKADWIKTGLGTEIYKHSKLIGWIWFNENKEKDWRVNSDPDSLNAFKSILP